MREYIENVKMRKVMWDEVIFEGEFNVVLKVEYDMLK